jgi:hypothetical protein
LDVNRVSIRELERKARVTQGLFRKPLGGDMRLSYRHVLQMVDAVGAAVDAMAESPSFPPISRAISRNEPTS